MLVELLEYTLDTKHIAYIKELETTGNRSSFTIAFSAGRTLIIGLQLISIEDQYDDEDDWPSKNYKSAIKKRTKLKSVLKLTADQKKSNTNTIKELKDLRTALIKLWSSEEGNVVNVKSRTKAKSKK